MTAALAAALVASVLAKTESLVAAQAGKDAREIAALDRRAEALAQELRPAGWLAAAPLGAAASDHKRPAKVRLFATSYLGFIADPAAFAPLEDVLLDAEQPGFVRSLAAQSLPGTGAPDAAVSRALCAALAQEGLPREAAEIALLPLSRLGCPEPAALVRLAKAAGPRPSGRDLALTAQAAAALGASRGAASGRAALSLVSYFPPQGDARARAIAALDARRDELAAWLAPETLPVVIEALRTEGGRWDTMLALVRIAALLGPEAVPSLARLSRHSDAEVLVAAAEALAASGLPQPKAVADLEAAVAGAMTDPRFSPKDGRPDPAALLARLEKALAVLKRAR
ncbi:MAG: hypothetical protein M0D55_19825 [Elusimicrobiota bacterium]|nr:MAG: hypothetical protein M0D55_19825 [Elusimicrobiota bacterium]